MSPSALARQNNAARQQRWRDRQREARLSNSLFRAAAAVLRGCVMQTDPEWEARRLYGKDHGLELILRGPSTPATLTTPGWGGVAAHDIIASELIQKITALSAAAALMTRGLRVDFTGVGSITVPGRTYAPTTAGDWIGEGMAIPLRQPPIVQGPKLQPRKLGVLMTMTHEMILADSIEDFVTAAIKEAAAGLLDLQLFSSNPGDASHPPGILLGATTVPASTVGEPWAISTDIGALIEALATNGGGLEPIIIAAPSQAASLRMWRQESYYDIYASLALPNGTVCAVESSSFVSGLDGIPQFSTSIGATLHMESATPADIASGGTMASPVKNLFQTDVVGLKMILRATWGMRNPKHVAVMSGTSW